MSGWLNMFQNANASEGRITGQQIHVSDIFHRPATRELQKRGLHCVVSPRQVVNRHVPCEPGRLSASL